MSLRAGLLPLLACAGSSLIGCGTHTLSVPAAQAFPPHFGALRDRILVPRCASCHTAIVQYTEVTHDLVVPGEAAHSPLFTEIDAGRMPRYGQRLSAPEIAAIRDWIDAGASND